MIFDVLPKGIDIEHIAKPFFEGKNKNGIPVRYTVKVLADFIQARFKKASCSTRRRMASDNVFNCSFHNRRLLWLKFVFFTMSVYHISL